MANSASRIAEAVKAAAPAFTPAGGSPARVVRRKEPTLNDGESPPLIVVTVGDETEQRREWAGQPPVDRVAYTVALTLVTKGGKAAADDDAVRDWRQASRQTLVARSSYPAVPGWDRAAPGGRVPFVRPALRTDLVYTTVVARVEVLEDQAY